MPGSVVAAAVAAAVAEEGAGDDAKSEEPPGCSLLTLWWKIDLPTRRVIYHLMSNCSCGSFMWANHVTTTPL